MAFQKIDTAAGEPPGQRHAEMASTTRGPTLVEFEDDRAVGHVLHMPHRSVVERGDFHHGTFREKKKAGAAPEGTAPAVTNPKSRSGYDAHRPVPRVGR
jgi:hypothetical protein